MEDMIPTSVTLPPALKERAEEVARLEDRSLSSLMRAALLAYLRGRADGVLISGPTETKNEGENG